jgi:titin
VLTIAPGDAIFDCDVEPGSPAPEVKWFKDGHEVRESKKYTMLTDKKLLELKVTKTDLEDEGTYSCEIKNALGKVNTSAKLTVHSKL